MTPRYLPMTEETEEAVLVRTDFSDVATWELIQEAVRELVGSFQAFVEFVDDTQWENLSLQELLGRVPPGSPHTFMLVADATTMSHPDHPLLAVDLSDQPGRIFRAVPRAIQSIENNLSIANMDFEEFVHSVDDDGIFRDFHGG